MRDSEHSIHAGPAAVMSINDSECGLLLEAEHARVWRRTPWDTIAFGIDTFEAEEPTDAALRAAHGKPGHYTARVHPLTNAARLVSYGFYYCDTLIEPHCERAHFRPSRHPSASITIDPNVEATMSACHGAFEHGRFHRDFNIPRQLADLRYDNWLRQLLAQRKVLGLNWDGRQVGFFAVEACRAVLHAIDSKHRGRGIAKFLWSAAIEHLFEQGCVGVSSSVSAANLAIINLYGRLGFRFRNSTDIYHLLVSEESQRGLPSGMGAKPKNSRL
jgi:ribosomal protein S18 acetylase RimI-like enzyme